MFLPCSTTFSFLILNMNIEKIIGHEWCMFDKGKGLLEKKGPIHMLILSAFNTQKDSWNIIKSHEIFMVKKLKL